MSMGKWPSLSFAPINLWNVPYMFKERTILDKILDEELRYYIRMNKYAKMVYLGGKQFNELREELGYIESDDVVHGLDIIRVDRADYLRVG